MGHVTRHTLKHLFDVRCSSNTDTSMQNWPFLGLQESSEDRNKSHTLNTESDSWTQTNMLCVRDERVSIIQARLNLLGPRFNIIVSMVKILKETFFSQLLRYIETVYRMHNIGNLRYFLNSKPSDVLSDIAGL